jgi:intein/homing endonuclease
MLMSADVNEATLGVKTPRVNGELLLAASSKLLGINKGEQEPDAKDSLQFQRVYGPADYFAEHVLKDANRVGRDLLWKATNKTSLDFMPTGALDDHVGAVFNGSKLANLVDASSPLELMDSTSAITRIGEGGIPNADSAPDSMRLVDPSFFGYIDPVRSVDSFRVGLDAFLTKNVQKGSDGKLYQTFINARTGKPELVDSVTASRSVIAAPEMMNAKTRSVYALGGKTGVRVVNKEDIDYYLPAGDEMYSAGSNMVPLLNACKEMRLHMGAKYSNQAVSLDHREAPLVRAVDSATGKDMSTLAGKYLGSQRARKPGRVVSVTNDAIKVHYDDGTRETIDVYRNFPLNHKGFIDSTPIVKPGQRFDQGAVLTTSNYTNDKGEAAIGTNLRTGWLTWKGATYEDAVAISESAAKKLSSTTMYKTSLNLDKTIKLGKRNYLSWKPTEFTDKQLAKLDDDGIVKPGTKLMPGDPMVLCVQASEPSPGTFGKRVLTDKSERWEHDHPGIVTDVFRTRKGIRVYAKMSAQAEVGDKLSNSFGAKGTVAKIIPDDEMPHGEDGQPLDILFSPLSLLTRTNPSMLHEALLGKVAQKTGKVQVLPQFYDGNIEEYILKKLKDNGLNHTSTVTAGKNGRQIPGVITGVSHIYKLKHLAESKMDARGTGDYTAEEQAGSSSKRYGSLETQALVGYGVWDAIEDAKLVRGQSNSKFWRDVRTGEIPTLPGEPKIHQKFFAHLQGSGVNVRRTPKGVSVFALSEDDVDELAGPRELRSRDTYTAKTFEPIDGGLFGQDLFGINGDKWAYIQLDEPVPNPVMEKPLMQLLDMKEKDFIAVVSGGATIDGMSNASDMKERLSKMNLAVESKKAREALEKATKSRKDEALKKYVAIERMRKLGKSPDKYMLTKLPVLPAEYRPITSYNGMNMVADSNYLYAQLLDARDDLRAAKDLPPEYQAEARGSLYRKWKELVGLYEPEDKKLQSKNVKGLLGWAIGGSGRSPKQSALHRKVLGATVDTVGRGVAMPDSRLKLNEVGVPEKMAFEMFAPMLERSLVKQGYKPIDAMKMVKEQSPQARAALVELIKTQPVQLNRAPTLHKYGILGLWPVLVKGHAIRTNPSICPVLNLDFDGNCCDFDSKVMVRLPKSYINNRAGKSAVLDTGTNQADPHMRTIKESRVLVSTGLLTTEMRIGEFPIPDGAPVVTDRNGAYVYDVSKLKAEVLACDRVTGKEGFYPVTNYTVEKDVQTVEVTAGNRKVIVSDNESLAVFDADSDELVKKAPAEALGKFVPQFKKNPVGTFSDKKADPSIGWLVGAYISDGWITPMTVGYAKLEKEKRDEFVRVARKLNSNFHICEYSADSSTEKKLGKSVKIHLNGKDIVKAFEALGKFVDYRAKVEAKGVARTALFKCIDRGWMMEQPEEVLWGLFSGLLDGDGSLIKNMATGKPRFGIRFSTSSPRLRDDICSLCYTLGVRYSVTVTPPRNFSNEAYTIIPSTVDMADNLDNLTLIGERENTILQEWKDSLVDKKDVVDTLDIIPVGAKEFAAIKEKFLCRYDTSFYSTIRKQKSDYRFTRAVIMKFAEFFKEVAPNAYARALNTNTIWAPITAVTDAGVRDVYDLAVEGAKVFAVNDGFIIWDTMNVHAPVTRKAKEDTIKRMMPERNLLSMRDRKIAFKPEKEYIQGLYFATRMRDDGTPPKIFNNLAEAKEAYRSGEINIDDPIRVLN